MEPAPITTTSSTSTEATDDLRHLVRLKELFHSLPDSRVLGRMLHPLPEVLLIALCAKLSDCEDYTDTGDFALSQLQWL